MALRPIESQGEWAGMVAQAVDSESQVKSPRTRAGAESVLDAPQALQFSVARTEQGDLARWWLSQCGEKRGSVWDALNVSGKEVYLGAKSLGDAGLFLSSKLRADS